MKANFEVETAFFVSTDNCILVDNIFDDNVVSNLPLNAIDIHNFRTEDSIGVWKIKKLKQP